MVILTKALLVFLITKVPPPRAGENTLFYKYEPLSCRIELHCGIILLNYLRFRIECTRVLQNRFSVASRLILLGVEHKDVAEYKNADNR